MQTQTVLEQVPESTLLSEAVSNLARNMVTTIDTSRKDRLWPADAMVFQTNRAARRFLCTLRSVKVRRRRAIGWWPNRWTWPTIHPAFTRVLQA